MAEFFVDIPSTAASETQTDMDMSNDEVIEVPNPSTRTNEMGNRQQKGDEDADGEAEDEVVYANGDAAKVEPKVVKKRETLVDYLKSEVFEIVVGTGEDEVVIAAHKALLTKSPWFEKACQENADVCSPIPYRGRLEAFC
jgi:hypothetical protein